LKTEESCISAIKSGWIAGGISLAITLAFSIAGFFTQSVNPSLAYFLDPWMLLDAVIIAVLVWFMFKKSRVASTLMLAYFIFGKVMQVIELGQLQGLPVTVIFFIFYFNAMRATYVWHSKYKERQAVTVVDESI